MSTELPTYEQITGWLGDEWEVCFYLDHFTWLDPEPAEPERPVIGNTYRIAQLPMGAVFEILEGSGRWRVVAHRHQEDRNRDETIVDDPSGRAPRQTVFSSGKCELLELPDQVDQTEPEKCAACGEPSDNTFDLNEVDGVQHIMCERCWCIERDETDAAIRARQVVTLGSLQVGEECDADFGIDGKGMWRWVIRRTGQRLTGDGKVPCEYVRELRASEWKHNSPSPGSPCFVEPEFKVRRIPAPNAPAEDVSPATAPCASCAYPVSPTSHLLNGHAHCVYCYNRITRRRNTEPVLCETAEHKRPLSRHQLPEGQRAMVKRWKS